VRGLAAVDHHLRPGHVREVVRGEGEREDGDLVRGGRFWAGTFAFAQFAAIASQTASGSYRAAGAADEFGVRRAGDQRRVDADMLSA
jgi:hypothetical protein